MSLLCSCFHILHAKYRQLAGCLRCTFYYSYGLSERHLKWTNISCLVHLLINFISLDTGNITDRCTPCLYLVPVVESLRVQQQRQAIVLSHLQQGKWNNSSLQLCIQSFCLAFCPLQDLHTNIVGFETSRSTVVPEIIKKDSGLQNINACCISLFVRYISASF